MTRPLPPAAADHPEASPRAGEAEVALVEAMFVAHYGGTPADALQGLGVDGLDYERKAMRRVLAVVR